MPRLLCNQRCHGTTDVNQSIYRIAPDSSDTAKTIPVFTTVATYHYTPSPSCIRITTAANPTGWTLTNYFIPGFYDKFITKPLEDAFWKNLQAGSDDVWKFKKGNLLAWQNEVN